MLNRLHEIQYYDKTDIDNTMMITQTKVYTDIDKTGQWCNTKVVTDFDNTDHC